MKKVGAKPGQLVRSASRRGKTPSKFHFDITVEKLFGPLVKPGHSFYVKWSRGVKVAQTKPVLAEKEHSGGSKVVGGLPIAQKMSLLVTLYRRDEVSKNFDEKDARLLVVSVGPKGMERTVAKLHFDLSQYAGVPSASLTKVLQFSDKLSAKVTIDSRLTKAGASGPGSAGNSSAISGLSAHSSDGSDGQDDPDDLTDLNVDDVPEPTSRSASQHSQASPQVSKGMPGSVDPRRKLQPVASSSKTAERNSSGTLKESSQKELQATSPASGNSRAIEIARELRELRERRAAADTSTGASLSTRTASGKTSELNQPAQDTRESIFRSLPSGGNSSITNGLTATAVDSQLASRSGTVGESRLKAELDSLKDEHEKVLIDLRRAQDKRKRMEAQHESEINSLREKLLAASNSDASSSSLKEAERREAQQKITELTSERDSLRAECDDLRAPARDAERLRAKNKELSSELDRLTVLVASSGGKDGNAEFENRLARLQGEKEAMEGKLRAHQAHSAKVKETYQKLTTMYNQLRDENQELQSKLENIEGEGSTSGTAADGARDPSGSQGGSAQVEVLQAELRDARQNNRSIEASKEALERDFERVNAQLDSLQERHDQMTRELREARKESDELHAELNETIMQRDNALKHVQSSRTVDRKTDSSALASAEARLAEAMMLKEQTDRDVVRIRQRVAELEREIGDLTEDLEYEKAEKMKAREERDALRESARVLERRTSEVSQAADAVHSLQRQLSTHRLREADQSAMITDLREEVDRLQAEVDELRSRSAGKSINDIYGGRSGAVDADVVETLVMTKLALATAEDEKLQLQFALKTLKSNEKAVQERLAAHASRLEVKLSEANDELERYRRRLSASELS